MENKKRLEKLLDKMTSQVDKILKKEWTPFSALQLPKTGGVYLIKEKTNRLFNGKIFYVGRTKNLASRLKSHTAQSNDEKRTSLRTKLARKKMKATDIPKYLAEECLFIIA